MYLIAFVNGEISESCYCSCHCLCVGAGEQGNENMQSSTLDYLALVYIWRRGWEGGEGSMGGSEGREREGKGREDRRQ